MASQQGKIALQLTQWVGGTIIILMFIFVLADYAIQAGSFHDYQGDIARRNAEGLKDILERAQSFEDTLADVSTMAALADYVEQLDRQFIVFDDDGNTLLRTPAAAGNSPHDTNQYLEPRPGRSVELRQVSISGTPGVAGVVSFETRNDPPEAGTLAYVVLVEEQQHMALKMWGARSVVMLAMIIATMVAVRIPVKRFVVAPIDGLFLAAYAASRDDFQKLPPCPVDNEFAELYDMFNRMMGHLSDTRIGEASVEKAEEEPAAGGSLE